MQGDVLIGLRDLLSASRVLSLAVMVDGDAEAALLPYVARDDFAAVFVQASEITARVPSIWGVTLAWITAGLLTMGGALVCAELSSAMPKSGGVYVFLKEAFSPAFGFLWGWAMFWSMHTGIAAAIATVFARYAGYFVPMGDVALRVSAAGAIVVLSLVNVRPCLWGDIFER